MEFRRYNRINCSRFDLISGDIEVKQTMALGYLFSRSEDALSSFLEISKIPKPKYDKYIIDCEATEEGRIDILIRFYKKYNPIQAVVVEAKSIRSSTSASVAANQAIRYNGFSQLNGFTCIKNVTLTKITSYEKSSKEIIQISWSQLISKLHELAYKKKKQNNLIKSFLTFITNIEGSMNYYEEEILSISARETINAVLKTGIYECPNDYRNKKKSLFLAFRADKGEMNRLFRLKDMFELDLNDESAINAINTSFPGFEKRVSTYKNEIHYDNSIHKIKQVYFLDLDDYIDLSIPVRPIENNTSTAYYPLHSFIQKEPNSNIGKIIVQKKICVDDKNVLHVETNGNKVFTLKCGYGKLFSFKTNGQYNLYPYYNYYIEVIGANRKVQLKGINLRYDGSNHKWILTYLF